jgi:hypothetical protein
VVEAFIAEARRLALEGWRYSRLEWLLMAPHVEKSRRTDPPEMPEVLRDHGE